MRFADRIVGGIVLAAGTMIALAAQQTQKPPVFRTNTELVEIDVVVIDKDGKRVHGLTREDFVLKDRKKPQAIELERILFSAVPVEQIAK